MALSSARPFAAASASDAVAHNLRGLAEDLIDLRHRVCQEHGILPADYEILKALVDMPDATQAELAITAHASTAGLMSSIDRLHVAGLAKVRGVGTTPPAATDAGRLMVAGIDGTLESALDAVLGVAGDQTTSRLAGLLDACRTLLWEVGAAPVVAVLD